MKNIINKETDDLPSNSTGRRLRIAFFDYPDVFEDFYSHYSVDQKTERRCGCMTGQERKNRKEIVGVVISNKMDKWYRLPIR